MKETYQVQQRAKTEEDHHFILINPEVVAEKEKRLGSILAGIRDQYPRIILSHHLAEGLVLSLEKDIPTIRALKVFGIDVGLRAYPLARVKQGRCLQLTFILRRETHQEQIAWAGAVDQTVVATALPERILGEDHSMVIGE